MKVFVQFGPEIDVAVQQHLNGGKSVQSYIRAAVNFFNDMHKLELTQNVSVGYGDKSRFRTYNTEVSPNHYLESEELNEA